MQKKFILVDFELKILNIAIVFIIKTNKKLILVIFLGKKKNKLLVPAPKSSYKNL